MSGTYADVTLEDLAAYLRQEEVKLTMVRGEEGSVCNRYFRICTCRLPASRMRRLDYGLASYGVCL